MKRGETITTEHLDVAGISQADDAGEFDIFLPAGIVTRVDKPSRCPAWLPAQIIEKSVTITVSAVEQRLAGYFTWHEAKHEAEKKIDVLAIARGPWDGAVYYAGAPENFWTISGSVFKGAVYAEDFSADSYETQHDDFARHIGEDIARITNSFSVHSLLGGLETAGIDCRKVTSIAIKGTCMVVTLKAGGRKVLQLGK